MGGKTVLIVRKSMSLAERLFLPEILRGLWTTNRHFWRQVWHPGKGTTLRYPEASRPLSTRWRGLHRLMHRADGSARCVACMLCATHCPAHCMTIVAGEHPDPTIEKVAVRFEIDLLKCIYCGFCVEACPCDAIRMDTGTLAAPVEDRASAIITLPELLSRSGPSKATASY
jgi:NADH-quinone oxidoreductase subunit I